ncbi:MAG: hypothetical protein WBC83_03520 [Minisyncoccia bacterium]
MMKKLKIILATLAIFTTSPLIVLAAVGDMVTYNVTGVVYPSDIAFDGTNMWVSSNINAFRTAKISPSGVATSYLSMSNGGLPVGIAFDRTNMWVAGYVADSVTKVSSTGSMVDYYGIGAGPWDIAFDGTNMWTVNDGFYDYVDPYDGMSYQGYGPSSVTRVTPSGAMTTYYGTGYIAEGIAFDGTNMWVANYGDNSVTKISPTGAMTTYTGTGASPYQLAFDGTNMWTANYGNNSVTKISPTGAMTTYTGTGVNPCGIAFDGTNMWTGNYGNNSVTKISPTGSMTTYTGTGANPCNIAFDGVNMWTANLSDNTVTKIVALPPTGTVSVSSNISSSWTITGPATITGSGTSQTSASQSTGTYTITWGAVAGYTTPASQSLTLASGGTITFNGNYVAALAVPTVTTPTVAFITTSSATLGANVTSLGNPATITARGTCWGTTASPTTNCASATGTTTGIFTHARASMTANTTYYFRGYADNSTGRGYSADGTFTTKAVPTVTTPTVTSIIVNGATLGANVTSLGNPATISARGICWGTTASPTTNCFAATGTTIGIFTHNRIGMSSNTTYYFRGYATNSGGTGYSADGTFTTKGVPIVTTPTVTSITTSGATLGANVTSLGNPATITARGTCWGTTVNPTTNCVAATGTTTGIFTHVQAGMLPGTTYYYRGYATNSTGTGYSANSTFMTNRVPTVTTPTVTSITSSGATLGAYVTSLGLPLPASITARGTCWGTTANPTTNCVAATGTTIGIFTHARASMAANTTYYYRGYATNSAGTGYSADGTFTTNIDTPTPPTISGPATLVTGYSGTYSFVSTDPQGEQISYAVDWNSDGTDLWMPYGSVPPPGSMTYVNSGVSQSASKSWTTPGTYTVRVLAQDIMGNNSSWTTYTITVSDPQPCTAGVVDSSGSWAPTCATSATCLTPPDGAQLTNQPGIQIGLCPTPEYTGTAYRACSTATITCTPATSCGDNICNGSETILTCPADCKARYQQF